MTVSIVPRIDTENLVVPGARLRTGADAGAFGAHEARALQTMAKGVQSVAKAAADADAAFDEADALRMDVEYARRVRQRLDDPEQGYLFTARGGAAIERRQEVEQALQADLEEVVAGARSERARVLARDAGARRFEGAMGRVSSHLMRESEIYRNGQFEAQINEGVDALAALIAAGNTDDAAIAAHVRTIDGYVDDMARTLGWSPEQAQSRRSAAQSAAYAIAVRQAAAIDPQRAQEVYNRISSALDAEDRLQLETTLAQARRQREDELSDAAWVAVSEGRRPNFDGVPGTVRIAIQNEIRRRHEAAIADAAAPRDEALVSDLLVESMQNPESFLRRNLQEVRGRIGESAYRDLSVRQQRMRNGESTGDEAIGSLFRRVRRNAEIILGARGFDINPSQAIGRNDDEREALARARSNANRFNAALLEEVERFEQQNPGLDPDPDQLRILIGRALVSSSNFYLALPDWGRAAQAYNEIPPNLRSAIAERLRERLGRDPRPDEVTEEYLRFRRTQRAQR